MPFCGNCGIAVDTGLVCATCEVVPDQPQREDQNITVRRFSAGVVDLVFAAGVALGIAAWMIATKKIIPIPGLRKMVGLTLPVIFWVLYLLLKDGFGGKSLGKVLKKGLGSTIEFAG